MTWNCRTCADTGIVQGHLIEELDLPCPNCPKGTAERLSQEAQKEKDEATEIKVWEAETGLRWVKDQVGEGGKWTVI